MTSKTRWSSNSPDTAPLPDPPAAVSSAPLELESTEERGGEHLGAPISPKRYKTRICRNYLAKGKCPYDARCMFAHGPRQLRTESMNISEGLVSVEALKAFKREEHERRRANPTNPRRLLHHTPEGGPGDSSGSTPTAARVASSSSASSDAPSSPSCPTPVDETVPSVALPRTASASESNAARPAGEDRYTHDPYAWSWTEAP